MRLIKFRLNNPEHCAIIKRNDRFPREYRTEQWYFLLDKWEQIVAECCLVENKSWFGRTICFTLCDMFVESRFRGNSYAPLLILNVLCDLVPVLQIANIPLRIHAWRKNKSAIRAYQKVFGAPYRITRHLVSFSTH